MEPPEFPTSRNGAGSDTGDAVAVLPMPRLYAPLIFPYFAPAAKLPAPLPTVAEILTSEDLFPCIFHDRHIRRVGQHFVVKHGQIKLDEAESMHFVAEQCGDRVLVPRLYAAFRDEETSSSFIVMEYVQGRPLESLWDELGEDGRARVAAQLRTAFDALRGVPSPGYYGRAGGRPFDDIFLGSDGDGDDDGALPRGPFETEAELNEALCLRYASLHPGLAAGRGAFYRERVLPAVMRGHRPVLTHGDLQAKNVLVRGADGRPCLIDWECSAWYPSYWEYTNALWTSRRWGDDWFRFLGQFLDEHVVEFKCVENLLGDLLDAPQPGV